MPTPSPHDAFFKRVFSDPKEAASLLKSELPPKLAARIDWSTLAVVPGSFVDTALSERRTDLLFSCSLADREVLLYLLLEHQSSADHWMALRILRYVLRIWERWLADHPDSRSLPMIIPIVVHHGARPWRGATEVSRLVELDKELRVVVDPYLPKLEFVLDDLTVETDKALRARSLRAMSLLAIRLLVRLPTSVAPIDELARWLPLFRRVLASRTGLQSLRSILEYVHNVADVEPEAIRTLMQRLGPGAEEAYMTTAQRLRDEGRVEASVSALLHFVRARFGPPSEAVERRIRGASIDELEVWLQRVATAETVDGMFAP